MNEFVFRQVYFLYVLKPYDKAITKKVAKICRFTNDGQQ